MMREKDWMTQGLAKAHFKQEKIWLFIFPSPYRKECFAILHFPCQQRLWDQLVIDSGEQSRKKEKKEKEKAMEPLHLHTT